MPQTAQQLLPVVCTISHSNLISAVTAPVSSNYETFNALDLQQKLFVMVSEIMVEATQVSEIFETLLPIALLLLLVSVVLGLHLLTTYH
jgi:hypothetical protein